MANSPKLLLIRGRVSDQGKRVENARVLVAEAPAETADVAALTNESGEFVLEAPCPGRYVVEVHATGYRKCTAEFVVDQDDDSEQDLQLDPE